ncbi:hypothetical protein ACTXT7_001023 [Hymenolepis weldensis]
MKRLSWESLKGWEMGLSHTICQKSTSNSVLLLCCVSLRSRELQAPFLDPITTDGKEKWWILYNNVKRKRQSLSGQVVRWFKANSTTETIWDCTRKILMARRKKAFIFYCGKRVDNIEDPHI